MKDRGRKRNSVSVEFLGIDPDVIQELTKRRKLAGILSAALYHYVEKTDEGRLALASALVGYVKPQQGVVPADKAIQLSSLAGNEHTHGRLSSCFNKMD